MFSLAALAFGLGLLAPGAAFAWGPGTHLELGTKVIANLGLLPLALQELLREHPLDYFYGSIAADIIVGKKFTHYLRHCHRWALGLEVLDKAENEAQKSFAWGYLSHLAADVVAHNYFVPYKTMMSFNSRGMNHTYWEVRFDTYASDEVWLIPPQLSEQMLTGNDELLKRSLSNTLFSFRTNKVIFNSVILMGRFRNWQNILRESLSQSATPLDVRRVEKYKELSLEAILSFLIDKEEAWCFKADPTGHQSLKAASVIRTQLKKKYNQGTLGRETFLEIMDKYRPHLKATIYDNPNSAELVDTAMEIIGGGRSQEGEQTKP